MNDSLRNFPPPEAELRAELHNRMEIMAAPYQREIEEAFSKETSRFLGRPLTAESIRQIQVTAERLLAHAIAIGRADAHTRVDVIQDKNIPGRVHVSYSTHRKYEPIRVMGQLEPVDYKPIRGDR